MIWNELAQRGLIKQCTDHAWVRSMLNDDQITFYIGFDPTADSLHVGHLLQLVTARRLIQAGHKGIMLIGGATAQIGDPTGKSESRKVLREQDVITNGMLIEDQIKALVPGCIVMNNNIWFKHSTDMGFLEVLKEFGPHFSVNNMLRADSVKSRMENGLSFLEFSYMLLQAIDFFKLNNFLGTKCVLQIGGDDQWANILAGIDLIQKKRGEDAFGLTLPLLVNSDGTKMGKTERGAVWLDSNKTPVFDFFQFWRNIPDDKVKDCVNFFTDFEPWREHDRFSDINQAKKFLAFEVTKLVHGELEAQQALEQAEALFEKRDASVANTIQVSEGSHILDVVVKCGFAKSRTDARNLIINRGITINEEVQTNPTLVLSKAIFGDELILKKGKKHFFRLLIEDKCPDQNI